MTRPTGRRRSAALLSLAVLAAMALSGCARYHDPYTGAPLDVDPNQVFASLMTRPDIDQATQRYEQLRTEIKQALSAAIPELTAWQQRDEVQGATCGFDYPGIHFDGETRGLPNDVVSGNLPDDKYEQALVIIGRVAQQYGFNPAPQRLHDAPGDHDAVFHNVNDDGEIYLGTAKNTVLGLTIGCHLTAEAKKRGHLAPPPSY